MRRQALLLSLFVVAAGSARLEAAGCQMSITLANAAYGRPQMGGFDLSGTSFAGKPTPGPSIRFWAFGSFEKANSGTQNQLVPTAQWIANPRADDKMEFEPGVWALWQANWQGRNIAGCILDTPEPRRTVVEISFAEPSKEGTKAHQGYFAVASIGIFPTKPSYNFDDIKGATGAHKNIVPAVAIPAPQIVGAPKPLSGGFSELTVELPEAASYSEDGKDLPVKLVRGYRVVYMVGSEPTTSDPAKWSPARDPKAPAKELAYVKAGRSQIAVPSDKDVWIASVVVYEDPSMLVSQATSSHVAVGSATGGSGTHPAATRERGAEQKRAR